MKNQHSKKVASFLGATFLGSTTFGVGEDFPR